jgi:hypothetical protein
MGRPGGATRVAKSKSRAAPGPGGSEATGALVELAREIQAEVAQVGADIGGGDALVEALEAVPRRELAKIARQVFDRLPVDRQWAVIEKVFDDDEMRSALADVRQERLARLERRRFARSLVGQGAQMAQVDLRRLRTGSPVTVGLCTERDAGDAVARGHLYASCARRIDALHETDGLLRVVRDLFNPLGGYFVTRSYDEAAWSKERLSAHALVRIGSVTQSPRRPAFAPVLYAGGRADFEVDGRLVAGRLHVGYLMVEDVDLFVEGDE